MHALETESALREMCIARNLVFFYIAFWRLR